MGSVAVDELTGKQLGFTNLLVCFAGIADHPGNSGGVQQVDYVSGGEAYFFTWRSAAAHGRRPPGAPAQGLRRRRQRDLLQPGQDLSGPMWTTTSFRRLLQDDVRNTGGRLASLWTKRISGASLRAYRLGKSDAQLRRVEAQQRVTALAAEDPASGASGVGSPALMLPF